MSGEPSQYGCNVCVEEEATQTIVEGTFRKRKLTSKVWRDFVQVKKSDGTVAAICKHCNDNLARGGTSHLSNHLKRKHRDILDGRGENVIDGTPRRQAYKFDPEKSGSDLANLIIKHSNEILARGGTDHLGNRLKKKHRDNLDGRGENVVDGTLRHQASKFDQEKSRTDVANMNESLARGGTGLLGSHLKRKHGDILDEREKIVLDGTPRLQAYKFDQEKSRIDLANMIIKHNYSLNMVDHDFFRMFVHGLNPNFHIVPRNIIREDILSVHEAEKKKIYDFLDNHSCKIALTTDMWTVEHQNFGYACLTAHFIDDDWNLKKKILVFRYIEYPHDGEILFQFISELILEWNIDRKLSAMVVDNAGANDVMVTHLKDWLCDKSMLSLGGGLFHVRCSAHILNQIVQDGLSQIETLVSKIRATVKYLNKSPHGKQIFDNAVNQLKLRGCKMIPLDVANRWNSTYEMLEVAIHMKEAFGRLAELDRNYKFKPEEEEWEVAIVVRDCLKVFFDATLHLSGSSFPTLNVFFNDVCRLQLQLLDWEYSEKDCLRLMAGPMRIKFENYWEECSLVLAIAVVLDPRFKMEVVEFYYNKIYREGSSHYIERVGTTFEALYNEYANENSCQINDNDDADSGGSFLSSNPSRADKYSEFDEWRKGRCSSIYKKSELDRYLEEPLFPRKEDFCILHWWKINSAKYPIVSKIARDILAIPATTVASESAFSVGGRVIDDSRASLHPELVEALVTTGDWLESPKKVREDTEASLSTSLV